VSDAPPRSIEVAAAVVWREGRVLLTRRPPGGPFGLKWEFPGGKLEPGETAEQALVRELREELGVGSVTQGTLAVETYEYAHGLVVELHFVRCELDSLGFTPSSEVHEVRWSRPSEVDPVEVLEADRGFLAALVKLECDRSHG
jgi:8-oxo-dGTP diphosphatase